jgi:sugar lactone lactonase YvrE
MKRPSVLLLGWLLITASAAVQAQSPPSITNDLTNVTVVVGDMATLSIGVVGTGPFTYQWLFNGAPLHLIATVAGKGISGYSGDGGAATNAELNLPAGVGVDSIGNLFIADHFNSRIREVGTNGIITTLAGDAFVGYSGDGGPATNAEVRDPMGVAVDSVGNVFIADTINNRIREVSTNGIITTVAGTYGLGWSGDGGPATNALLNSPSGVAVDSIGNLFIADTENNRVREVGTNGIMTLVAGNTFIVGSGYSGDGGLATNAQLHSPTGVAMDSAGNLFIADQGNNCIREVDTNGIITTLAGNGGGDYSGDGGLATNAQLNAPAGVAVDGTGNLFIADLGNNRIRVVDTNGIITTLAGSGTNGYSSDGGPAINAQLNSPCGVALDSFGNLFIGDYGNNRIREVATSPNWPTVSISAAGSSSAGNYSVIIANSYGSVTSSVAKLTVVYPPSIVSQPQSQLVVNGGNANFTVGISGTPPFSCQWLQNGMPLQDCGNMAGSATSNLTVNPVESTNSGCYNVVVTNAYGAATSAVVALSVLTTLPANQTILAGSTASFSVAVSGTGQFIYQWLFNGTNPVNNIITTVAGNGGGFVGDGGPATNAELRDPMGVAVDSVGNVFIADYYNNRIRKVDTNGLITTVAGNGHYGFSGDGSAATNAQLNFPTGVAVDSIGHLFIADQGNNRVREVGTNGIITTVAGKGVAGYSGDTGPATNAQLYSPTGVAVDSAGNLFTADQGNNRTRKVGTNGIITTVAGKGAVGCSGDGGPATNAQLNSPRGVAVDSAGNLFIADEGNSRIRKVGTNGIITTVAGKSAVGYSGDGGTATNAGLFQPAGVAVDNSGNLFIADTQDERIRKVDTNGLITTVAGNGHSGYSGDGSAATNAELTFPAGVAVDSIGNLLIADEQNNRIREVIEPSVPTLLLKNVGASNVGNYSVVISSSYGSVTSSVATLTVVLPPVMASIVPASSTNSVLAVQFQFSGTVGANYVLEYTTSLSPPLQWVPVITNAADANGNWIFTDTNATAYSARFFRIATP